MDLDSPVGTIDNTREYCLVSVKQEHQTELAEILEQNLYFNVK